VESPKVGADWIAGSRHGDGVVSLLNKSSYDRRSSDMKLENSSSGSDDDEWSDPDDDAPFIDGGDDSGSVDLREAAERRGAIRNGTSADVEMPYPVGHADILPTLWHRPAIADRFERRQLNVLRSPADACSRSVFTSDL
jgi:hypothetical protein